MCRRLAPALLALLALLSAACGGDDGGDDASEDTAPPATFAPPSDAEPQDFSGRGPYAVGQIDLQVDPEHQVAVFYPVDPAAVTPDAEPYSYSGEDILDPTIVPLLPGSLAGEVAPADTWVGLLASGDGPFPTVLHSHGFSGNFRFGNQHNAAVASWGYVVAAVDHPERGLGSILDAFIAGEEDERERPDEYLDSDQLIAGLDLLAETNEQADSPIAGAVDTEQVAAEGHSAGGSASGTLAYDDRVDLWIGQAPGAPLEPGTDVDPYVSENEDGRPQLDTEALLAETSPPPVPSLIIAAEGDTVVPLDRVEAVFDWLDTPKRLVVIADSGHAVFVDPCQPIQAEGGLSGFVEALGLDPEDVPLVELGENGCLPEDTPAETVWAMIDHVTVAQLNSVFGIDPAAAEASLTSDYLAASFPDRFLREDSEG